MFALHPMIRRDYLLTMIEQLGAMVRAVMNREATVEQIDDDIENLTGQWIGLPSYVLFSLPETEVHRLIQDSDRMVAEKCFLMAELFRTKGLMDPDETSRREFNRKALYFFRHCPAELEPDVRETIAAHIAALTAEEPDTRVKTP